MSMFRSPNDVSSSVDESTDSVAAFTGRHSSVRPSRAPQNSRAITRVSPASQIQSLQPHQRQGLLQLAFLEDRCKETAWLALNKGRGADEQLSRDDPIVEVEAQATYNELVPGFNQTLMLPEELTGPEGKLIRQSTMAGLDGLLYNATASRLSGLDSLSSGFPAPILQAPTGGLESAAPFIGLHLATTGQDPEISSAPLLMMGSNNSLFINPSPYKDDHQEISLLGKGGYGQVWKVRNHLDDQLYAVKKIVITSQRLQKFSQNAQVEALLAELRTLAKLHHTNIVRYYNGWIEKTDPTSHTTTTTRTQQNLLEGPSETTDLSESLTDSDNFAEAGLHGLTIQESTFISQSDDNAHPHFAMDLPEDSGGIVFADDSVSQETHTMTTNRDRRASRNTDSSTRTFTKASLHSVGEGYEEDEDIETIPRSLERQLSVSHMSHSRAHSPTRHEEQTYKGPDITLFIKMSLHPTTLSSFLSPDTPREQEEVKLRHCFHQQPSIEMLSAILDGVEYLHSQRIVHRDLKPANIFLSVHKNRPPATRGFVDIKVCPQCNDGDVGESLDHIYLTPCIGDFGLIAEMKDTSPDSGLNQDLCDSSNRSTSSLETSMFEPSPLSRLHNDERPVGTQFYRPNKMPIKEPRICPKLDVYSLGVIAFELLCKFDTRTERAIKLSNLGTGSLPEDFQANPMAEGIASMVREDRDRRWDCDRVRGWLDEFHSTP